MPRAWSTSFHRQPETMTTPLCQIAMSVTDLPRTHAWYTAAFGFLPASGTNSFKGYLAEKVQGVAGAASTCWWLMDQQDFFQLELFQFHRPSVRALPSDWRPCDIGYSTVGLWVADFDQTLQRLEVLGTRPLTSSLGEAGDRRVCVRDPEGVLLELFEADPIQDRVAVARPNIPVLTVSVTLSVPDLGRSRAFFCDVLGLQALPEFELHRRTHEALWGLAGADARRLVLRAGDTLVELVQYLDPPGKVPAADYRISDQGLLNIALGYRQRDDFNKASNQCAKAGIEANWRPLDMGAWKVQYVNDSDRFSVELLHVQPWYDGRMGFTPRTQSPNLSIDGLRSLTVEVPFKVASAALWERLSDHESMADWWPLRSVLLVREAHGERNGVGAVRRMRGMGLVLDEEVTAWQPGYGYDYKLTRGAPVREHAGSARILPSGAHNVVQWRIQFRPRIPGSGALIQWLLRVLIKHVLLTLKKQLEQPATTTSTS